MTDRSVQVPNWRIIAELAAFFIVAILLARIPGSPLPLADLKPHPFGIAVLVAALVYGTRGGALATLAAVVAQMLTGWPQPAPGDEHFSALARQWSDPCLWLALTLLIGDMRDRQLSDHTSLSTALGEARAERDTIAAHAQGLRERIGELEAIPLDGRPGIVTLRDPGTGRKMAMLDLEADTSSRAVALEPALLDQIAALLAQALTAHPEPSAAEPTGHHR